MDRLLKGKFDPATQGWGFLECDVHRAAAFFTTWLTEIRKNPSSEPFQASLPAALTRLGAARRGRVLLSETRSPWTAVFVDRGDSWISEVSHPSLALPCRAVHVQSVEHTYQPATKTGNFGAVGFQLHSAERTDFLNVLRSIQVAADEPGWYFSATGPIQSFEQPDAYDRRVRRNRFTIEMLDEYCRALGLDPFDPSFYGPYFVLFTPSAPGSQVWA